MSAAKDQQVVGNMDINDIPLEDLKNLNIKTDQKEDEAFKKPFPPSIYKRRASKDHLIKPTDSPSGLHFGPIENSVPIASNNPSKRSKHEPFKFNFPQKMMEYQKDVQNGSSNYEYFHSPMAKNYASAKIGESSRVIRKSPRFLRAQQKVEDDECSSDESLDDSETSEEEDVDSDGECDEEVQAVLDSLEKKKITDGNPIEVEQHKKMDKPQTETVENDNGNVIDVTGMPYTVLHVKGSDTDRFVMYKGSLQKIIAVQTVRHVDYQYQIYIINKNKPIDILFGEVILSSTLGLGEDEATMSRDAQFVNYARNIARRNHFYEDGGTLTEFDNRFLLVKKSRVLNNDDRTFVRNVPRDYKTEPPIIEEVLELTRNCPEKHPKAHLYPPAFSYAMIEYSEDRFWTERTVDVPPGVLVPNGPRRQ
ncbi:MX region of TRA-2 Related [Caenorhabditis elegans]|nr:MX region of TRA-2 Related [Caenorhabditis elegans]CZR14616.1 MX region of TRA-2 Related [Caenorhabditis elegans]|eukprot:NP_001309688.1 MX region of TRA-2 Related [Caenorhabditis elegans]